MRSVLCDSVAENLLSSYGKTNKLTIGLLIGQIIENGKDFIVHLAKTPHSEQKSSSEEEETTEELSNIADIKNSLVAEHALNAIRMIVGGFNILGLFVVSENNIMSDNSALQKLKTVLMDIKSTLDSNGILYANTDEQDNGDKLVLNYITSHKNYICKTISTDPSKAPSPSPVDFKFVSKGIDWYEFETIYEIDTAFPLLHSNNHFDTEKHIMATIDDIAGNLAKSIMFFNGDPQSLDTTVEKFLKDGSGDSSKVKVTIYSEAFQAQLTTNENGILTPHESLVHYTGIVASRIYGAPRNTIAEIERFIRNDIIRSITTRLQIYYDALLANDDGGNDNDEDQDVNSTIPPRRVFFHPGNSPISFCDYLFQNENEDTTVKQSMEILGVDLNPSDVDISAEAVAQLKTPEKCDSPGICEETVNLSTNDSGKLILILGIIGLLVALIVSVALHFILK
ncbi:protein odr-4 homolog isoform X1 [Chironomus tepperi]|uniref:protein odr-4 homolog isoform X1 n=1 Tax=Chironomus tepperi TaxID=113505 RepID=UPI00391F3893